MNRSWRTVLVVDDSLEYQELYQGYLLWDHSYTYHICQATLGKLGLEMWHLHQPDVILLDYKLPDLDGLEFLAELKRRTPQLCLPVVIVIGQGNEDIAMQALRIGAQDYLVKDQITPERLQLTLHKVIEAVQLGNELHQRMKREQLLSQITKKIHQTFELSEILQTTVDEVRHFLNTDRVLIFQVQSEGWGTVTTESVEPGWTPLVSSSYYDPCLNKKYFEVFRQGRITLKADIYDGSVTPCHVDMLAKLQVRANLVVPILQNGTLWGMLIAHHCQAPRYWEPLEVDSVQELAVHVGIAVQQAYVYQQARHELLQRRQVEAELRESEARLAMALNVAGMGVWDGNVKTNEIFWSPELEILLGYAPGNSRRTYAEWAQRVHPEDLGFVELCLQNSMIKGEDFQCEYRVVWSDGTVHWVTAMGRYVYDLQGQPIRMYSIVFDITDRKQAEEALKESEKRLQLALEGSEGGLWDWDMTANVDYLSRRWLEMLGFEEGELPPEYSSWEQLIHPDDKVWVTECLNAHLQNDSASYKFEYRMLTKSGEWKWIANYGKVVMRDEQGKPLRMAGIHYDISDRKAIELALQENQERLRVALESANMGIWDYNLVTDVLIWDEQCKRMWGLPLDAQINYELFLAGIHPDDRDRTHKMVQQAFNPKTGGRYEVQYRTVGINDGIERWIVAKGTAYFRESGQPVRFIGTVLDITEYKLAL